jgi:hypothetical protein
MSEFYLRRFDIATDLDINPASQVARRVRVWYQYRWFNFELKLGE